MQQEHDNNINMSNNNYNHSNLSNQSTPSQTSNNYSSIYSAEYTNIYARPQAAKQSSTPSETELSAQDTSTPQAQNQSSTFTAEQEASYAMPQTQTAAHPEQPHQVQSARTEPARKKSPFGKLLLLLSALIIGIGGGCLGSLLMSDHIEQQTIAAMKDNISQIMAESGSPVLYRSANTNVATTDSSINVAAVSELTANSVVEISTEVITNYNWFGYQTQTLNQGAGSGVIISEDGFILTCHHVIDSTASITVTLKNGEQHEARVVGSYEEGDLAVIKIEAEGLTPAVLGNSSELVVGSPVVAIGNPLGQLGGTVTAGYISALERELIIDESTYVLLQTDAAINGGNSGGGLFNANGELIGLVNAKAQDIGVEGLGFAIPIDDIKQDIEDIITYGYVTSRVSLGVKMIDISDERTMLAYNVDQMGVYILTVQDNSNASYAGLLSGDCILRADGKEIKSGNEVVEIIATKSVGDTLQLDILRNGKDMHFSITMYGTLPENTPTVTQQTSL